MNCIPHCTKIKKNILLSYSHIIHFRYLFQFNLTFALTFSVSFYPARSLDQIEPILAVVILRKGNANEGNHAQGEGQLGVFNDQLYNYLQKKSSQDPGMEMLQYQLSNII